MSQWIETTKDGADLRYWINLDQCVSIEGDEKGVSLVDSSGARHISFAHRVDVRNGKPFVIPIVPPGQVRWID